MSPTRLTHMPPLLGQEHIKPECIKPEPMDPELDLSRPKDSEDSPTDLSMDGPTDLSSNSTRHVSIVCAPDTPLMRSHNAQHFFASEEDKKEVM